MNLDPIQLEVDPYYHLVPILNLVRKSIVAESALREITAIRRMYPDMDRGLNVTGANWIDEDLLAEDASSVLAFVTHVLQQAHEREMDGENNGN